VYPHGVRRETALKRLLIVLSAVVFAISGCAPCVYPEPVQAPLPSETAVPTIVPTEAPTITPTLKPTPDPMRLATQKAAAVEKCLHDAAKDFEGRAAELLAGAMVLPPDVTYSNSPAYPYESTMEVLGDIEVGVTPRGIVVADYRFEHERWTLYSSSDPYLPGVEDNKRLVTIHGCLQ
jgi:hypothetical protein